MSLSSEKEQSPDGQPASSMGSAVSKDTAASNATRPSDQSMRVSGDVIEQERHDPMMSRTEVRTVKLRDMREMVRNSSTHFSEVTLEQIERVRHMHDRFSEGAEFNFNYNILLIVASVLAGLGLASNSSTTVIASMLVSPIMGPVVAVAYGITISDAKLVRKAFKTEVISLFFCIIVGALIGICTGWTDMANAWPNDEQVTRCTWQNFFVGLPIAFFSGLGVAVSLLDEQTNSLVGVAISASLLPPAVNCGTIWVAYSFVEANWLDGSVGDREGEDEDDDETSRFPPFSRDQFFLGGTVSLLLTVANIILIIVASMMMFRMKERLPIKKKVFWEDLRVARKIYQNRALLASSHGQDDTRDNDPSLTPQTYHLPGPIMEEEHEGGGKERDEANYEA